MRYLAGGRKFNPRENDMDGDPEKVPAQMTLPGVPETSIPSINEPPGSEVIPPKPKRKKKKAKKKAKKASKAKARMANASKANGKIKKKAKAKKRRTRAR
jgi:hypothetical protein